MFYFWSILFPALVVICAIGFFFFRTGTAPARKQEPAVRTAGNEQLAMTEKVFAPVRGDKVRFGNNGNRKVAKVAYRLQRGKQFQLHCRRGKVVRVPRTMVFPAA